MGNTTQNCTAFAYTTWYSNIVGSVSQELEGSPATMSAIDFERGLAGAKGV